MIQSSDKDLPNYVPQEIVATLPDSFKNNLDQIYRGDRPIIKQLEEEALSDDLQSELLTKKIYPLLQKNGQL